MSEKHLTERRPKFRHGRFLCSQQEFAHSTITTGSLVFAQWVAMKTWCSTSCAFWCKSWSTLVWALLWHWLCSFLVYGALYETIKPTQLWLFCFSSQPPAQHSPSSRPISSPCSERRLEACTDWRKLQNPTKGQLMTDDSSNDISIKDLIVISPCNWREIIVYLCFLLSSS